VKPALAAAAGGSAKALIAFGGKPLVSRTISELRASVRVHRIAVVGGEQVLSEVEGTVDIAIPEGTSAPDNIVRAMDQLMRLPQPPERVLIVTTDLPFLASKHVAHFLDLCSTGEDIFVPIVERDRYLQRFPNSRSMFVRLRDDSWTMGCCFVLNVETFMRIRPRVEEVFANRKSPIGMAKLLGGGFLLRFLTKQLSVPDIESKVTTLLSCSGRAVRGAAPELAFDIDDVDDFEYARSHWSESR
jgi:GTP:adenosylcobinamide-phosphate guanylyltransferase